MSNLDLLVDTLKRSVAVPGTFETTFPNTDDSNLLGALMDGFAEAQLDGFFITGYTLDLESADVTPDLRLGEGRLVAIYAACQFIQAILLNLKNKQHYAAKGVIFETEQTSTVLTATLAQMESRKAQLVLRAQTAGSGAAFHMADGYFLRATQRYSFFGSPGGYGGYDYGDGYSYNAFG